MRPRYSVMWRMDSRWTKAYSTSIITHYRVLVEWLSGSSRLLCSGIGTTSLCIATFCLPTNERFFNGRQRISWRSACGIRLWQRDDVVSFLLRWKKIFKMKSLHTNFQLDGEANTWCIGHLTISRFLYSNGSTNVFQSMPQEALTRQRLRINWWMPSPSIKV